MLRLILVGLFSVAVVVSLAVAPVAAQQAGQTPGGGGAAPAPSAPTPTTPSPNVPTTPTPIPGGRQPSPGQQPSVPDIPRPIFLSGKVVLEDGTPPPDSVVIERVCNGIPRPEGYTDSKGRFSFQLGQNKFMMADASVGSDSGFGSMRNRSGLPGGLEGGLGASERELWGCEVRASLAGYSSEVVRLDGRRSLDNPNVGTIVLRRYAKVEGTVVSLTSLQAPKEANKAFDKGRDAMRKQKWADARKQFEKAVEIYPQYAQAWCELGTALERLNDASGARAAYGKAMTADAKFVNPYLQMAGIAAKERNWQELVDTTDRVVKLDSFNYPGMFFLNAVGEYNLQHMDAAEKSAREALKLDTQKRYPAVNHILGVIMARRGEYTAAADFLNTYLKLAPAAGDVAQVKKQLAEIEKVASSAPEATR